MSKAIAHAQPILLALILSEAGLRSSLIARLAYSGADVITAHALDDRRLARRGGSMILITDAQAMGAVAAPSLADDPRWQHVIVVGAEAAPVGTRLHHAEEKGVPALVRRLIAPDAEAA